MGIEQKKWVVTLGQLTIGLLIHAGVCLWLASAFVTKMKADVLQSQKELEEHKATILANKNSIIRIDSEGSIRFARESQGIKEQLKELATLLRESRESQARIEAGIKRQ